MQPAIQNDSRAVGLILILTALEVESALFYALLKGQRTADYPHAVWGSFENRRVLLANSGPGSSACLKALEGLQHFCFADSKPEIIIFLGTAGALNPYLMVGDVVVADQPNAWNIAKNKQQITAFAQGAIHRNQAEEGFLWDNAGVHFHVFKGTILTWPQPVFSPKERQQLFQLTGAGCVDMEAGAGAHWCEREGIPFLAVKGISDQGNQGADPAAIATAVQHATLVAEYLVR